MLTLEPLQVHEPATGRRMGEPQPQIASVRTTVTWQHRDASERIMIGPEQQNTAHGAEDLTALLLRTGLGDERAFAALYERAAGWVYGLVLRILRNPSLSEEVAQEVMVEVWRQAARFDAGRGSAKAWIMTIAHRRAVDRVRSEQASADRDVRVATHSYRPAHDDVVEQVEINLDRQRVRRMLAELTEVQRQTIELAYFKGYTQTEIAHVLGLPLGTVKTRMRDGLIRLRDAMGVTS